MKIPTPIGNENTSGDGNTSANWRWIYHHLAKRLPRTWPDISLWKIHGNLLCKRYVPHYSIPSEEWNWKPNRLYQNLYKYAYVLKLHSINIGPYNATEFEIVKWTKIKDFSHFKKANQNTIGLDIDRIGLPNLSVKPVIISKSVYSVSHFSIIVSPKKSVNLRQGRYSNYP